MIKFALHFLALLLTQCLLGQTYTISGRVVDSEGFGIDGVRVYADGSSLESFSDGQGDFEIAFIPPSVVLVFEHPDYYTSYLDFNQAEKGIEVILERASVELNEVVVAPDWEQWQFYFNDFRRSFIGEGALASRVDIKNAREVLRFDYNRETNELTARARDKLIIDNPYLGYEIEYDLVSFKHSYRNNMVTFEGTSFFREKSGGKGRLKRWKQKRRETFAGSLQHFIKLAYANQLSTSAFEIRQIIKFPNPNYPSQESINRAKEFVRRNGLSLTSSQPYLDTLRMAQKPKQHQKLIDSLVWEDHFIHEIKGRKYLKFDDFLEVQYHGEKAPRDYVSKFAWSRNSVPEDYQESRIHLEVDSVEIFENGNTYPGYRLISQGYWAWEKIAHMLPLDYSLK